MSTQFNQPIFKERLLCPNRATHCKHMLRDCTAALSSLFSGLPSATAGLEIISKGVPTEAIIIKGPTLV